MTDSKAKRVSHVLLLADRNYTDISIEGDEAVDWLAEWNSLFCGYLFFWGAKCAAEWFLDPTDGLSGYRKWMDGWNGF